MRKFTTGDKSFCGGAIRPHNYKISDNNKVPSYYYDVLSADTNEDSHNKDIPSYYDVPGNFVVNININSFTIRDALLHNKSDDENFRYRIDNSRVFKVHQDNIDLQKRSNGRDKL